MSSPRLYHDLSWLWPIISPPEDYVDESERFTQLIRQSAGGVPTSLLHLGCGGGHNDHIFLRHFQVTGVDISGPMLDLARRLNPRAEYLQGDIRSVRLGKSFSAVAALDAINYMLSEDDLRAVFATAYGHLSPGGVFLTYAEETRERFQQNKTAGSSHASPDLEVTFVENLYDPNPGDTTYEATFLYLIRRKGILTIETDTNVCGVFPLDTWIKLLFEAGFEVKQFEYYQSDEGVLPVLVGVKPR